jgi:hypothetical protein
MAVASILVATGNLVPGIASARPGGLPGAG